MQNWNLILLSVDFRLVGDIVNATSFLAYSGPFNQEYRALLTRQTLELIVKYKIPHTEGLTIQSLLVESSEVRKGLIPIESQLETARYLWTWIWLARFQNGRYRVYRMMSSRLRMQSLLPADHLIHYWSTRRVKGKLGSKLKKLETSWWFCQTKPCSKCFFKLLK